MVNHFPNGSVFKLSFVQIQYIIFGFSMADCAVATYEKAINSKLIILFIKIFFFKVLYKLNSCTVTGVQRTVRCFSISALVMEYSSQELGGSQGFG